MSLEDDTRLDDALTYAKDLRDLLIGAAALLRASDRPSALEEIVAVGRARSDTLVTAIEQELGALARARSARSAVPMK